MVRPRGRAVVQGNGLALFRTLIFTTSTKDNRKAKMISRHLLPLGKLPPPRSARYSKLQQRCIWLNYDRRTKSVLSAHCSRFLLAMGHRVPLRVPWPILPISSPLFQRCEAVCVRIYKKNSRHLVAGLRILASFRLPGVPQVFGLHRYGSKGHANHGEPLDDLWKMEYSSEQLNHSYSSWSFISLSKV